MLKLTGGLWKGQTVPAKWAGPSLRPTTGLVRQSWFNQLQTDIANSSGLDCFAGSGLMTLEALSRGASHVLAIEKLPKHATQINHTLAHFGVTKAQATVWCKDALAVLQESDKHPNPYPAFNWVYVDPPYAYADYGPLLEALLSSGCLAPNAIVGIECASRPPLVLPLAVEQYFERIKVKTFGDSCLIVCR
jgi:16S rRNA (guanine966-N2)-methyltransferase